MNCFLEFNKLKTKLAEPNESGADEFIIAVDECVFLLCRTALIIENKSLFLPNY